MAQRHVPPAEGLARQILKAAAKGAPAETLTLALIESWFIHEAPDAVRAAVGHAIWAGWLTARDDGWRLTALGLKIGRREHKVGVTVQRRPASRPAGKA